jgi:hypothetical protein
MSYKIEKGINVEDVAKNPKYPFSQMEVGDSFIYATIYNRYASVKVSNAAHNWCKKQPEPKPKFSTRKTKDGMIRVWRIA